jgi:hypothetical protein
MKKILFLIVLAAAIPAAAAEYPAALSLKAAAPAAVPAVAVTAPALVRGEAANKAEDNTRGYLAFTNWGLYADTRQAAIVIYGPVARNLYDTMTGARYRPAPYNLASLHPREVSREICEARVGVHLTCLKIPKMTADALVLTNGRPTYTDDSYQCDIHITNSKTMEFSLN